MTEDDDANANRFAGGCQCGAVRYAFHGAPRMVGVCHCRMCQKAVGGPFFAFGAVKAAALTWTGGPPAWYASSSAAERAFCTRCGTPLAFRYRARPGWVSLALGSLDHPERVTPTIAVGIESRLPWTAALPALPGEITGTTNAPEDLSRIVKHQHPDRD